jgi:uncharacterized membrane protein
LAVLPFFLLTPLLFMPPGYHTVVCFMVIMIISTFRLVSVWPGTIFRQWNWREKWVWLTLGVFAVGAIVYGVLIQQAAFNRLSLTYWDWAIFLNVIDNTAHGRWFYSNDVGYNFMSRHFSLVLLLLVPYVMLFRSILAFFILNSIILISGGPLLYLFCRRRGISAGIALVVAVAYLLSPSIINMNLAVMYGFHAIYIFIPALLAFFIFFEDKKYMAAYCCFAFSLLIKETTGAFWLGTGIAIILNDWKMRKHGIVIAVVGLTCFILCMTLIQPWFTPENVQDNSLYRYQHLGKTEWKIAMSPFISPGVFWQTLFRPCCIYYISLLLIIFICLAPARFWLMCGSVVILVFTMLQDSSQLQNIHLQYQAMPLALLWCVVVICLKDIKDGRDSYWWRCLLFCLDYERVKPRLMQASVSSLLCGCLLGNFFLGINPIGKESIGIWDGNMDFSNRIAQLKKIIPKGKQIAAPVRLSGHLVLHNDVYTKYDIPREYMLLDLADSLSQGAAQEALRRRLLTDDNYSLILNALVGGRRWMLFKRGRGTTKKINPLFNLTEAQWRAAGAPVKVKNQNFSVRMNTLRGQKGSIILRCYFRLERKVDRDFTFTVRVYNASDNYYWDLHFADGIWPADMANPGDIYRVDLPVPLRLTNLKGAGVKITPLPKPAL